MAGDDNPLILPTLYLARHCKTHWNQSGRLQGSQDLNLSEAGRAQAGKIAQGLKRYCLDRIVSSPYRRAIETASIYAESLQMNVEVVDGLKELNHGQWEGQVIDELLRQPESQYRRWLTDPVSTPIPDGENVAAAQRRITRALHTIIETYPGQRVLVITHKHIRALLDCWLNRLDLNQFGKAIKESVEPDEIPSTVLRHFGENWPDGIKGGGGFSR